MGSSTWMPLSLISIASMAGGWLGRESRQMSCQSTRSTASSGKRRNSSPLRSRRQTMALEDSWGRLGRCPKRWARRRREDGRWIRSIRLETTKTLD